MSKEKAQRPGEGAFMSRGGLWVLAQIPILFLALLLPLYASDGAWFPRSIGQWTGLVLTIFGIGLSFMGVWSLGDALTPFPTPRDGARLRRAGVYARIRHPIYAGLIVAVFGWSLWRQSVWGFVYALLVFLFFDRKAAYEEARLERAYPDYGEYARRVRKFFPGLY